MPAVIKKAALNKRCFVMQLLKMFQIPFRNKPGCNKKQQFR